MKQEDMTAWECLACGTVVRSGDIREFGSYKLYLCHRHRGGKRISTAVSDERRRLANEASYRTRGYSSEVYLKGLLSIISTNTEGKSDG